MCMHVFLFCEPDRIDNNQMGKARAQIYQKTHYPLQKKSILILLKNLKVHMGMSFSLHRDPRGRPREEKEIV